MSATVYVSRGRRRRRYAMVAVAVSLVGVTSWKAAEALTPATSAAGSPVGGSAHDRWASVAWPARGSAAVAIGNQRIHRSGTDQPVPIASLAKVMTALVVLHHRPISSRHSGLVITITADDVDDTQRRRSDGQSVIPVAAGEQLSEREALEALLLPSANNIAMALARAVSGSVDAFVDQMNVEASRLAMTSSLYTDPSGYDATTVSTAHDQLLLARAAMRIDTFVDIVAESDAVIPSAGVVHNTDGLLRVDGFVGIKTGSDTAAGGCFMFAVRGAGARQLVYGVVLGQRAGPLLLAALKAARRLADSVRAEFGIA